MSSIICRVILGFAAITTAIGAMCLGAVALFDGARGFSMERWWPFFDKMEHTGHAGVFAGLYGLFFGFCMWEHGQVRRRQRIRRGRCGGCDYDRQGTQPMAPCPECGDAPPVDMKTKPSGIRPILLIAGLFLAVRVLRVLSGESSGVC